MMLNQLFEPGAECVKNIIPNILFIMLVGFLIPVKIIPQTHFQITDL
jgi:hypothetical protein